MHVWFQSWQAADTSPGTLFFYFVLYALAGWLLENTYSFFTAGHFWKEGFLKGPFKPMYGFAPVILVVLAQLDLPLPVLLLACLTIPSLIEYVSGWMLQTYFHKRWWDYSEYRWQIHGHVCLPFSVCWLALSLFCLYAIHPYIRLVYGWLEPAWRFSWTLFLIYFLMDLGWTVWTKRRELSSDNQEGELS
ncbi:putative ABC transporter permease [Paenibacillus larvae]|uniref:putative ABC transporter permease n=1 Tax=Paenibacillus larvae TaxID=1464 RepID=UPI00227F57DB|nr:putative ABC transporter permease [Paenibacillus larvae]MCY9512151.1 putative ABC transporter permease [Paenibacillus larvae]MCY9524447.1 putative ABC transporter permease [Paenibacillus larvae]